MMQKHGLSTSGAYASWEGMRARCLNPNSPAFHHYGGRGISICPRWDEFTAFLTDMGERPEGATIDRIDVNGDYSPEMRVKRDGWTVEQALTIAPDPIHRIGRRRFNGAG